MLQFVCNMNFVGHDLRPARTAVSEVMEPIADEPTAQSGGYANGVCFLSAIGFEAHLVSCPSDYLAVTMEFMFAALVVAASSGAMILMNSVDGDSATEITS
jgi:hypothetical protein